MIKYLGSKRLLVDDIVGIVSSLGEARSAVDLFSGTSRVGHALKRAGFQVVANDHNAYAATLGRCYVEADAEDVLEDAEVLIREFNSMQGSPGYFTETFCEKSRFFQPKNGARVDAIRESISRKGLSPTLEAVVLTSLMEAADRVDSTVGLQMAYLKEWAPRAHNDLHLRVPDVVSQAPAGKSLATQYEALDLASFLEADVFYLDPPYNQHKYVGNYHIWESLVLWDKPEVYGVACKRVDVRDRKSAFNGKNKAFGALRDVVMAARCRHLVVSFSDEGFISRAQMEGMLQEKGAVRVISKDHPRYVGSQIGVYNPQGALVGVPSHLRNTEYLYIVEVSK